MESIDFQSFCDNESIYNYLDYRDYLRSLYQYLKVNYKPYSYRQMSDDLGFSQTNILHLIITGKRPLSSKALERILLRLPLEKKEKLYFRTLINFQNSRISPEREKYLQKLIKIKAQTTGTRQSKDQLEFFNEWYHIVIYQLCQDSVKTKIESAEQLARLVRPQIRPSQAQKSLDLLQEMKIVIFDEKKKEYISTNQRISTGDEIASLAIISYHQKMIELAKDSIVQCSEEHRDISAISVNISLNMIPKLKGEISLFRKKILSMTEQATDSGEEVYQMNVQLFPTTQLNKKKID